MCMKNAQHLHTHRPTCTTPLNHNTIARQKEEDEEEEEESS